MARDQAEKGGGILLKTLLFGALALAGIAAAVVILQPMLDAPSADVALIKAEPGPFRERPKDPGGTKIPHKDSTVMGMLGGLVDEPEAVEILQPPADVPEMPPLPDREDQRIVMAPSPAPVGQSGSEGATGHDANPVPGSGSDAAAQAKTAPGPAPIETADNEDDAVQPPATSDAEGSAAPLQALPKSKPEAPKGPAVEGDEPLYLVQLAAFRNATTAREQAAMLLEKHQVRLGGAELGTMKVDAGENGIFWRVITEPLQRATADSLCSALKRAGQDCILRKFDKPAS